MSNSDIISKSNKLLARVRKQIDETPSFISELINDSGVPIAIPFMTNIAHLDESVTSIQNAGDQPPEADETTVQIQNQQEAQDLLQQFFKSRMNDFKRRTNMPRVPTTEMPSISQSENSELQEEHEENEAEEEEEEINDFIDQAPILDEPYVFVYKRTTRLKLELSDTDENNSINCFSSTANNPNPLQNDDIDNIIAQDIAEDGLWVPDLPLSKPSNVLRMEYRLLWIDPNRRTYFGADYAMKIDTPPITQIAPPFPIEPYDHYGREFIGFVPASGALENIDIKREFWIEVEKVEFIVHPLSCMEDIMVKRIQQLYNVYKKDQEFPRVQYYKQKIAALREAWENVQDSDEEQEKRYLEDLHNCRELQEVEESNSAMIIQNLIKAFRSLRDIRSSGVTTTPLMLHWQRRDFSREEKEAQKREYNDELKCRIQEEMRLQQLQDQEPDKAKIKSDIITRAENLGLRKPGESIWKPVLDRGAEITPIDECPPQEKERKEQIEHAQIFLKYFINRQETHKSNLSPIEQDFSATLSDSKKWVSNIIPNTILVEIWETGYFKGNRKIAEVILPIALGTMPEYKSYEFSSDLTNSEGQLVMGTIRARCYIVPESQGHILVRPPDLESQKSKQQFAQDPSKIISVNKFLQMAKNQDPNDPYMVLVLAQMATQKNAPNGDKFRLDADYVYTTFASLTQPKFQDEFQQHVEKFQEEENRPKTKKGKSGNYVEQIQQSEEYQGAKITEDVELNDVVREAPMPAVPKIFKALLYLISMFRPLKPTRNPPISSNIIQPYSKATIRILFGHNIPERSTRGTGLATSPQIIQSSIQNQHSDVFCKITYNGKTKKTKISSGLEPSWNQPFEFKLADNDDVQPNKVEIAQREIRIDLFDEVRSDDVLDDREELRYHGHVEYRFLGSLSISVQALWGSEFIQANIPVSTPIFQLAYTNPPNPTELTIFGAVNPLFTDTETNREYDSAESQEVIQRVYEWTTNIENRTKKFKNKRRFLLMAKTTDGKPIVACRMIKKQNPPIGLEEETQLVRFVSLFPNRSDSLLYNTVTSVWDTSQKFINLNVGDDEEHAALLCNYFKYIGVNAYVVLGADYVNGKTSYVATIKGNVVTLYNPLSGMHWESDDPNCLLYSVGMVINDENVWANVQKEVAPFEIDWTFTNKKKWEPFFNSKFPKTQYNSPQPDTLTYKSFDEMKVRRIRNDLELEIKHSVEHWREVHCHHVTTWNRAFGQKIQQVLEQCEIAVSSGQNVDCKQIVDLLEKDNEDYIMNGGPFCVPYTTSEEIIKEVKIRDAWRIESDDINFALGVYIKPFTDSVLAVWIMLASLEETTVAPAPL